ncbi:hypothetical protein CY34DRAFT_808755 [Suillus luteus UH-Slu-Lm8-n1]|uniref:Uncharacterized protein n=1 Tax=Suillus luteus UH-Slu-Lm8-n1 TaxID=930992 RepID=A0A0D0AB83_9AGAM|nr:hypothetical protein CY34DRAFT_808755 [Suillus luteus UH-Slu-Lm8-n1]
MVLWGRSVSAFRSAGRLFTASTTNVPFQDRSLLHISRTCIPVPYSHPHQSGVSYYVTIRSSFSLGREGIYTARSSPKLNSADHSMSVVSGFPSGWLTFLSSRDNY